MPLYVGYTQKRRTVNVLNAGNDKYLLCPEGDIVLKASVSDDTNLKNANFEWVQIKGPEIPLTKDNELQSHYPFNDTEDKTFRFYKDKGTPKEQYADVNIYHTPTSVQHKMIVGVNSFKGFEYVIPDHSVSSAAAFPKDNTEFDTNFKVLDAIEVNFSDVKEKLYGAEILKYEVLSSDVFEKKPDEVAQVYYGNEYPSLLVLERGTHRFRVTYEIDSVVKQITSKMFLSFPDTLEGYRGVNTQFRKSLVNSKVTKFLRYINSNKVVTNTVSAKVLAASKIKGLIRYKAINRSIDESISLDTVCLGKVKNIVRVDPLNIGND